MDTLQGKFLVASAKLADPNFYRTVVLIVRHNEEGAMGMVVNRPASITVREVWEKVAGAECETDENLHVGGPCPGPLMALHGRGDLADLEIADGMFFTADPEHIAQLVTNAHSEIRFFAGYAGWGPGQIEKEIDTGAWHVVPAKVEHVFTTNDALWERLIRQGRRASSWLVDALRIRHVPPEAWMN